MGRWMSSETAPAVWFISWANSALWKERAASESLHPRNLTYTLGLPPTQ